MDKKKLYLHLILVTVVVIYIVYFVGAGGYIAFIKYPSIGTQGADELRKVIGDDAVARLESVVFWAQDDLKRLRYNAGIHPQAPWSAALPVIPAAIGTTSAQATVILQTARTIHRLLPQSTRPAPAQSSVTPTARVTSSIPLAPQQMPTPTTVAADAVCPSTVFAIGTIKGSGVWSPYLTNSFSRKIAACRTFFQPGLERPYAIVAVVAFNMDTINLHFVLGSQEPASKVPIDRPGIIPSADMQPNLLMAVFNGGFKSRHGHFGVMVNGVTLIPPIDKFGTIALYKDGTLRIGAWGSEIANSPDIVFWRQNGPLLVQKGQVNPRIYNQSPQDWGSSVDGTFPIATWRSAMGISADGKTMYYAAGPSMTLESLAHALITAGADQAVQLDINNYWVYFGEVVFNGGELNTIPLFPEWKDNPNRYLHSYTRDFFYITAKQNLLLSIR
jgi:hypothetical protein